MIPRDEMYWQSQWVTARLEWIEDKLQEIRAQQIATAQYYTRLTEERADLRSKR